MITACPACKSPDLRSEECEGDDFSDSYTATICNVCHWRSDTPPIEIARDGEGNCKACRMPIKSGDFVLRYGDDVVTHAECPTGAIA